MTNRILAAFVFFTRLPFWRLREVPADCFKRVVEFWPLVGWLTGGLTAAVLYGAMQLFPGQVAVLLALAFRTLITGALHEDGLGDFFDGFGGGRNREQTLAIMKDSRTGSYGLIGLVFYYLLLTSLLSSMGYEAAVLAVLTGDTLAKSISAQLINLLPYARKEEESKARVVYDRMSGTTFLFSLIVGFLPAGILLPPHLWLAALSPVVVFGLLVWLMKRRIGGYTGDCCGATFLLCELAYYLCFNALLA